MPPSLVDTSNNPTVKVATIITSVAEKSFSGPVFDEIKDAFPDAEVVLGQTTERILAIGASTGGVQAIEVQLRHCRFYAPEIGPYVETDLLVIGNSIKYAIY